MNRAAKPAKPVSHGRRRGASALGGAESGRRLVLDRMPIACLVLDTDLRFTYWNPAAEKMFGYRAAEALGRTPFGLTVGPEAAEHVRRELEEILAGDSDRRSENQNRTKDGRTLICEWRNTPLRAKSGQLRGILAMAQDVTERRRAERELKHAKERLERALAASSLSLWETDLRTGEVYLSEGWALLLGLPATPTRTTLEELMKLVHPEDMPEAVRLSGETIRGLRDEYSVEHRVRTADGAWKWALSSGRVTDRDPQSGRALRMSGTNRDISERKRAEQRLQDEVLFVNQLLDTIPNPVFFKDEQGRYLGCNRAFEEYLGMARKNMIGMSVYDLSPKELADVYHAADRQLFENPGTQIYEAQVKSGGGVRDVLFYKATFSKADGTLGGLVGVILDISERKRMEAALAQSEARFRDFARASGDWFWETDAENRFIWMSDSVEASTGVPAAWHYGKRRDEIAADSQDLSAEPWKSHLETIRRREAYRDFRYLRRGPNSEQWLSASGAPVYDAAGVFLGYRGVGSDVTRQVEYEQRAREADERLRQAIEHLDEPVCLTDAEERIVVANRRFRELNSAVAEFIAPGRKYEEHIREGIRRGLFPEAAGREEEWLAQRMAQRREGSPMKEVRRQSGVWLLVGDQKLSDGGTVSFGIDITTRKLVEQALRDLNEDLEQRVGERTAALEASVRELEQFSYSVSHDLRAPLRAIGGFARMVVEDEGAKLSGDGRRKLAVVEQNVERMGQLVDDLLRLARVNRAERRREHLDVRALASAAAAELQPHYPKAQVEVGLLPPAKGDPVLLRQALANLIENGLKFSARAEAPRVEVGWSEDERAWYVRDNGVGFDMQYAQKLFGAFERLHTDPEFAGTGIGLAIVKRVIERHHGRVWARSAPGAGATFYFTLG